MTISVSCFIFVVYNSCSIVLFLYFIVSIFICLLLLPWITGLESSVALPTCLSMLSKILQRGLLLPRLQVGPVATFDICYRTVLRSISISTFQRMIGIYLRYFRQVNRSTCVPVIKSERRPSLVGLKDRNTGAENKIQLPRRMHRL